MYVKCFFTYFFTYLKFIFTGVKMDKGKNGRRIEQLIEQSGLTKTKIAKIVGRSRETIYSWIENDDDDKYEILKSLLKVNDAEAPYDTTEILINKLKAQLFDTSKEIDMLHKRFSQKEKEIQALRKLLSECRDYNKAS